MRNNTKSRKIGRLAVLTDAQNQSDGVSVISFQCIGDVMQSPTGELIIKLNSYINFAALPTDGQGFITAIIEPQDRKEHENIIREDTSDFNMTDLMRGIEMICERDNLNDRVHFYNLLSKAHWDKKLYNEAIDLARREKLQMRPKA